MTKKLLIRGAFGFPMGVFIGVTITIIISWILGQGTYLPIVPGFNEAVGSQLGAVTLQYLLTGLVGLGCALSSVIFEMESWSILKQTVLHFLAISLSLLPISYVCRWMDHSVQGFLIYFGLFAGIYLIIWLIRYFIYRKKVDRINDHLKKN